MKHVNELRALYQEINTQFIIIKPNGDVVESDDVLFKSKLGSNISSIHPFFINISESLKEEKTKFTCVHLKINTKDFVCDITIRKLPNKNLLIILTDFSEHYNSFQSLAQSRNETAISSEFMEIDNYLLQKKETFKNNFIANFNHEIVSPVLSILTFKSMLSKTQLSHEQKEYLDIIDKSSLTLKRMVSDIFDISKIETGNLSITNKRFSLKKLVNLIKIEHKQKCLDAGLKLNVIYKEDMPVYIVSDKLRIQQIITNILDNAIKYTHKGSITITINPIYRRARKLTFNIKITDTGIGIDSKYFDFIFGRFNRLEQHKHVEGNGLGLAITKQLVELLDGEINIESKPNEGSEFVITLRTTTPLKQTKSSLNEKSTDSDTSKKELLLVENNYSDQLSIFKILAASKKYYVDIAMDGNEAIKLQKKKSYDLILMDYKMNSVDGFEAVKIINKTSKKQTPILVITGHKIDNALLKYYSPYFKEIIYKPFEEETLLKHVAMLIN